MSAYYLKGVVGKLITLNEIFQGMYPFMAIQIVAMLVLWLFPQLAYFLPDMVYGAGSR
jgi:TRAP-type mannitol/chloroaromatic compound transport system permease large subunit